MEVILDFNDIMKSYDPSKNTTKNILTKYERVKIIGLRSEQLQRGAPTLIKWEGAFDPRKIALQELNERKLPFMISRKLPDNSKEYYRLEDLIIL